MADSLKHSGFENCNDKTVFLVEWKTLMKLHSCTETFIKGHKKKRVQTNKLQIFYVSSIDIFSNPILKIGKILSIIFF